MENFIKHNLLLKILACLTVAFWINGCNTSNHPNGTISFCGPHSISFSANGTAYLLGYGQLLEIDSTGNVILNNNTENSLGFSDMLDISHSGNIWEVTMSYNNTANALTVLNSQGNFITQTTTDFYELTSVRISASTDIGWVGGWSNTGSTISTMLEALNISGQSLTSFTLPPVSLSPYNGLSLVKLAISPVDGTIWAWTPGYLSGYTFTGLVHGPYPINLLESNGDLWTSCSIDEKWTTVNSITNDIWMGNPATTTIIALSPDGAIRFQKNLDIYISTMAVSPKTGNVWVGSNNRIEVLDPYGNVIKQFTFKNLNCITYIAISPLDDTIWVGNSTNIGSTDKNIFILDENGNIVNSFHVLVRCLIPNPG